MNSEAKKSPPDISLNICRRSIRSIPCYFLPSIVQKRARSLSPLHSIDYSTDESKLQRGSAGWQRHRKSPPERKKGRPSIPWSLLVTMVDRGPISQPIGLLAGEINNLITKAGNLRSWIPVHPHYAYSLAAGLPGSEGNPGWVSHCWERGWNRELSSSTENHQLYL